MKLSVLVTGSNGQLAQTFRDLFEFKNNHIGFTFVSKSELDITQKDVLEVFFEHYNFDYVINCAAYTNVETAEVAVEDAYAVNAEAVRFLAECCKKFETILIHVSTDYVYSGNKLEPYLETDETHPVNVYGKSKLAGEENVTQILERYFIIRTSWLYSRYPKNFLTTIISKIKENENLTITTTQQGTPTSCIKLSGLIYWLINNQSRCFGTYNFSAEGSTTWYHFALKITGYFENYSASKITPTSNFKTKAKRPVYSVMSNKKIQKIYKNENHWHNDLDEVLTHLNP